MALTQQEQVEYDQLKSKFEGNKTSLLNSTIGALTTPVNRSPEEDAAIRQEGLRQIVKTALPEWALPKSSQIPELIGGGIGALNAVKERYPMAMALTGTLSTAGDIAKQVLQLGGQAGLYPTSVFGYPPGTFGESIGSQAQAFGRGALSEGATRGLGTLWNKAFGRSAAFTPEIEAQLKTAENLGIDPPLSKITESTAAQVTERLGKFSFFGDKIRQQATTALQQFKRATDILAEKISPDMSSEAIGENLIDEYGKHAKDFLDTKDALYDSFMPILKDTPTTVDNTVSTLKKIVENGNLFIANKSRLQPFGNLLERLQQIGDYGTFSDLKKLKGQIIEGYGPFGMIETYSRGAWKRVKLAIDADLTETALRKGEEVGIPTLNESLHLADKYFAEGIGYQKDKFINTVLKVADKSSARLPNLIVRKDNPQLVEFARDAFGDEVVDQVAGQWLRRSLNESMDEVTGLLKPKTFLNKLKGIGETYPALFENDPEKQLVMRKIIDLSKLMARGGEVSSGSQTAFAHQTLPSLISSVALGWISGKPILNSLAILGGSLGLQKGMVELSTSELGKRLMTRGLGEAPREITGSLQPIIQRILQSQSQNNQQE